MLSFEMVAFLEAEAHNCTAPNGSGEPTTLATAANSLAQMPTEILAETVGTQFDFFNRAAFEGEFKALVEKFGNDCDMRNLISEN